MVEKKRLIHIVLEHKLTVMAAVFSGTLIFLHVSSGYGDPTFHRAPTPAGTIFDIVLTLASILMIGCAYLYERSRFLSRILNVAEGFQAELEDDLENASIRSLRAFARAIDARDHYTAHHSGGVAHIAGQIAAALALTEDEKRILWQAGFVHDVGKIGIPDNVLLKPGRLNDEEYEMIKRHPELGATLLQPIRGLEDVIVAVKTHHERWDGKGYPYGLKEGEIPLLGRIMAVADAYEAMTSPRVYRPNPLSHAQAAQELVKGSGSQFDPKIVEIMLGVLEQEGKLDQSFTDAVAGKLTRLTDEQPAT